MRYTELDQMLKGRNQLSKKYGNNTYLHRWGQDIALQYHSTDVATFKPNGDIVLDSGGWHTSTTKERINWALPEGYHLVQTLGVWYLNGIRFADGMVIRADGTIEGGVGDTPRDDKALKAKVKAYAQLCADSIPLGQPSGGDCWYCAMMTTDGQTLGDVVKADHIDSHMEEGYVVPSLVAQALKECYNAHMAFWQTFKDTGWAYEDRDFGRQAVRKAVYRYIMKRKGFAL